jgi:hypothetical protein
MDSLDAIRHQINSGDQEGARLALRELLKAQPDNVDAWALLAILLRDPSDQAECYRQILRVNPKDRQAAAWLDALKPEMRRSSVDSMPLHPAARDAPSKEGVPNGGDVEAILQELDLPEVEGRSAQQRGDLEPDRDVREGAAGRPEAESRPSSFLDRIVGRRPRGRSETGELASPLDQQEVAAQPGSLSPANILRMAGGPIPPEERRKCPKCSAVVSRNDSRCPWCSAHLLEAGEG